MFIYFYPFRNMLLFSLTIKLRLKIIHIPKLLNKMEIYDLSFINDIYFLLPVIFSKKPSTSCGTEVALFEFPGRFILSISASP